MATFNAATASVWTPRRGQRRVEIVPEPGVPGERGTGLRPHHHVRAGRQLCQAFAHQLAQPPLDLVSGDRAADRLRHDKAGTGGEFDTPDPYRLSCLSGRTRSEVNDERSPSGAAPTTDHRGEFTAAPEALRGGQHLDSLSGRELYAALGATRGEDGAPGPGAHAQPEAVGLRAAAVVRLVSTLAHVASPSGCMSSVGIPRRRRTVGQS